MPQSPAKEQSAKCKQTKRARFWDCGELNEIQRAAAPEAQLTRLTSKRRDVSPPNLLPVARVAQKGKRDGHARKSHIQPNGKRGRTEELNGVGIRWKRPGLRKRWHRS